MGRVSEYAQDAVVRLIFGWLCLCGLGVSIVGALKLSPALWLLVPPFVALFVIVAFGS